jgi:ABC-2 type transport system ATP-binding protein
MNTLLEAHNMVKRYGNRVVVKGIDLMVSTGEIVALIGPNGAGKSTTLEMVLGLRMPDSGKVVFWCKEPLRQIGVQLQSTPFFRGLTVSENLTLFANFYGVRLSKQQVDRGSPHRSIAAIGWSTETTGYSLDALTPTTHDFSGRANSRA